MVASGWFRDPYGRHEARWFSEGRPTSLVRDGAREGTDPPTGQVSGSDPAATPVPENAPTGASDLRRSDEENGRALPEGDRYGTMASDTMARTSKWPVPGVGSDDGGPSKSKRQVRGVWFIAVGVLAIVGGNYLIKTPSIPTHRFVPSPRDLAVVHDGGTALPASCPDPLPTRHRITGSEWDPTSEHPIHRLSRQRDTRLRQRGAQPRALSFSSGV